MDIDNGQVNTHPLQDTGMSDDVVTTTVDTTTTEQVTPTTETSVQPLSEYEIDGIGKVKIDEIKEWKKGYLRQQDYTKKTQDVAKQRNETKDALEVYNFLRSNPQIAQAFSQGDFSAIGQHKELGSLNPTSNQVNDLAMKIANMELNSNITDLKNRFGDDFDELATLQEAERIGVYDLEFIHNSLQGRKLPTLKEQIKKELEKQLTEQIRKNGLATETIVTNKDKVVNTNHGLTPMELKIADSMGLSPEQYAKGKI